MTSRKPFLEMQLPIPGPHGMGPIHLDSVVREMHEKYEAEIARLRPFEGTHKSTIALLRNEELLSEANPKLAKWVCVIREDANAEKQARIAELEAEVEFQKSMRGELSKRIGDYLERLEKAEALLVRNPKHDPPTNEPWAYEFYGNLVPAGAFAPDMGIVPAWRAESMYAEFVKVREERDEAIARAARLEARLHVVYEPSEVDGTFHALANAFGINTEQGADYFDRLFGELVAKASELADRQKSDDDVILAALMCKSLGVDRWDHLLSAPWLRKKGSDAASEESDATNQT